MSNEGAKVIMANIFRSEELLLDAILEAVSRHDSKPLSDAEHATEDKRMTDLGYPPTPEELSNWIPAYAEAVALTRRTVGLAIELGVLDATGGASMLTTVVSLDPIYVYADVDENSLLKFNALTRNGTMSRNAEGKVPVAQLDLPERDTLYLAVKLTLMEKAAERQKVPIILDDPFGRFDATRTALLARLQAVSDRITAVHARHVHWVWTDTALDDASQGKLAALLRQQGRSTLVAACDFVIASERAEFGFPEVQLGIPTIQGSIRMPKKVGWQNAMELLLTNPAELEKVLAADGDGVTARQRVSGARKFVLAARSVALCAFSSRFRRAQVPAHDASLHEGLRRLGMAP